MKKDNFILNQWRITDGPFKSYNSWGNNGAFHIPGPDGQLFRVIVSDQMGWDHVSVSLPGIKRCPTWEEMCWIKDLFFEPEEPTMQIHPKRSDYVKLHPYTLHIWRPQRGPFPLPPSSMVGPVGVEWKVTP